MNIRNQDFALCIFLYLCSQVPTTEKTGEDESSKSENSNVVAEEQSSLVQVRIDKA
jgi:hypothetical protein